MEKLHYVALTHSPGGLLTEIVTDAKASFPYNPHVDPVSAHVDIKALWDTGASGCCITGVLAVQLGLPIIGRANICHAAGMTVGNVYLLNVIFNEGMMFTVPATECVSKAGNFDIIIGMEILKRGDFSITNEGGRTKMSFRFPSQKHIDYQAELLELKMRDAKANMTEEEKQRKKNKAKAERKKHKH